MIQTVALAAGEIGEKVRIVVGGVRSRIESRARTTKNFGSHNLRVTEFPTESLKTELSFDYRAPSPRIILRGGAGIQRPLP